MGRLPATGRILCPLGQGTARPGPEFARGTGLARGSYGLHVTSVWEAVRTLAQQVPWHRMLDRVTVVLVRHGNGGSRDGNDDGNCDSLEDIGKAVSRVGSRWGHSLPSGNRRLGGIVLFILIFTLLLHVPLN